MFGTGCLQENRANYILEFKDKTTFTGKNQIIAEARFLRAYYHFELVKWFGGIPMKGFVSKWEMKNYSTFYS
jgi:hypothetical protein